MMNNLVITTCVLLHVVRGGPLEARVKREIYPEVEPEKVEDVQPQVCVVGDVVYSAEESVPAEQACLKCKCQPPGVHCEATKCEKKPGCRAIHKPNTCCPDYQCECIHEGQTYANGERLQQKPGTECKVCYCRGGEVQCAEVSCYTRNDCEGRLVPGTCCKKYDHCPPKEPMPDRPIPPLLNLTNYIIDNEINETEKVDKATQTDSLEEVKQNEDLDKLNQTVDVDKTITAEIQKITIHEIIPEIKEIPITSSPKRETLDLIHIPSPSEGTTGLNKEDSNEVNANNYADTETDSSELAEVYQQPPPVLRIGDKLLFLKKGELVPEKGASTPATIITIIGAEGLQRGFEESLENHEIVTTKVEKDFKENETDMNKVLYIVRDSSEVNNVTESPNIINSSLTSQPAPSSTIKVEEIQEINPEYPPIPDIMGPEDDLLEHVDMEKTEQVEIKILPEVLVSRSNKTVPNVNPNSTKEQWLKTDLNNETFNEKYDLLENLTSDFVINAFETSTSANLDNETQEIREEYVSTTPENSEESDKEPITVAPSLESAETNISDFVELLPGVNLTDKEYVTTTVNSVNVEIINPDLLRGNKNVTHEESDVPPKIVGKRQNDEDQSVFEELNHEIALVNGDAGGKTKEEEMKEAQNIFKELLEEATSNTTPKPLHLQARDSESAVMQRVSDAIAKFTLRDTKQSLDSNILGILRDFFSSQYKAYNTKK